MLIYSGDELYGDDITSGPSYLDAVIREEIILTLLETGEFIEEYLDSLTDSELLDLEEDYTE